jgi:hypothetical protein
VTGEPDNYVTPDEAHRYARAWAAYGHEGAPRPALALKRGVLVPEGMVAVNHDDLALLLDARGGGVQRLEAINRLRAAAS